jgi:hypothetical protein
MISPQVHRNLDKAAIKEFFKKNRVKVNLFATQANIDLKDDYGFHRLLDHLYTSGEISKDQLDDFLIDQLNYGKIKNVYISFFEDSGYLSNQNNIISAVNNLMKFNYNNSTIKGDYFKEDLTAPIPEGHKKVLYFKIVKKQYLPHVVHMLLGSTVKNKDGALCNEYTSIDINLDHKIIQIRLRNWGNERLPNDHSKLDSTYSNIVEILQECFNITIEVPASKNHKMIFSLVEDLVGLVLNPTENRVNAVLEKKIEEEIESWSKILIGPNYLLPLKEKQVMTKLLLNNFYKLDFFNNLNGISLNNEYLINLGVEGYPRYIKFLDETIGEGKAKSQTSQESVLDTDIFYDIRARLNQSQNISFATIYWITISGHLTFGISFYLDKANIFKYIVKNHYFHKEESDYVLRQIAKYYQRSHK